MPQSVTLKIDQAKKHLSRLKKEVKAFLSRKPFIVVIEEDSSGDLVYRIRIQAPIPVSWSADIGDLLHNLRSALDHLAWELVVANGQQPTRDTSFPISDNEPRFKYNLQRKLNGASAVARTAVENLKPYKGGYDDLWRIHNLNIIDKHRMIVPVGTSYQKIPFQMTWPEKLGRPEVEAPPFTLRPADRHFPLKDGAEIFRVKAAARDSFRRYMKPDFLFGFMIAFGDTTIVDGEDIIGTLQRFISVVQQVVSDVCRQVALP
jgi:hypothetical protein